MGHRRITATITFAEHAIRACLAQITFPVDLSGLWEHYDLEVAVNGPPPMLMFRIKVAGIAQPVSVLCELERNGLQFTYAKCSVSITGPSGPNQIFHCFRRENALRCALQKQYDEVDLDWLRTRAREILEHPCFEEFERVSEHAARVLRDEGGSTYGAPLDAAVSEFEKFITLAS